MEQSSNETSLLKVHMQFSAIVKTAGLNLDRNEQLRAAMSQVLLEYKQTGKLSLLANTAKDVLGEDWFVRAFADVSDPQLFASLSEVVAQVERGGYDGKV